MLRHALLALALCAASACAPTVEGHPRPALAQLDAPLRRIAVMPLSASPEMADSEKGATPEVAAQLVSRYLAEALAARGVSVIAPEDVERTLLEVGPSRRAAEVLAEKHGADAVLSGELTRWEEREGEALGTFAPAAVGFSVRLASAPAGLALWSAEFDERQQPLSDNVLRAGRYPGGGTRWLTAEELARWGAGETMRALPLGPGQEP